MTFKYYLLGITILFTAMSFIQHKEHWSGEWQYNSESSVFTIILKQTGNRLTGTHCSTMQAGNKIDCFIEKEGWSIEGNVMNADSITIIFTSAYSDTKGKAVIKRSARNVIEWRLMQAPVGEFYIPMHAILKKRKLH